MTDGSGRWSSARDKLGALRQPCPGPTQRGSDSTGQDAAWTSPVHFKSSPCDSSLQPEAGNSGLNSVFKMFLETPEEGMGYKVSLNKQGTNLAFALLQTREVTNTNRFAFPPSVQVPTVRASDFVLEEKTCSP